MEYGKTAHTTGTLCEMPGNLSENREKHSEKGLDKIFLL
jgi:hypothetical protein